jgi:hypothetical protein
MKPIFSRCSTALLAAIFIAGAFGLCNGWWRPQIAPASDGLIRQQPADDGLVGTGMPSDAGLTTSTVSMSEQETAEKRARARWEYLRSCPADPARNQAMVAFIEELAARDPLLAISLAKMEDNEELRSDLLQGGLRGWGGTAPGAAAEWAESQNDIDGDLAMAAVFHGAARDPAGALQLAAELSKKNPERARDYGSDLIAALAGVKDFARAAEFAGSGSPEDRVDWLGSAYSSWASSEPESALKHIEGLSDPGLKETAFQAAISRWSCTDPQASLEYGAGLPEGPEQFFALSVALRSWSENDPAAAAQWMVQFPPSPELDRGAAEVASHPDVIRRPAVATSWAESIADPQLRSTTLRFDLQEWARFDPAAALCYAETSPDLRPEDRAELFDQFAPGSTEN